MDVNLGLPSLILFIFYVFFICAPFWMLMPKFGLARGWSVFSLVPFGALVLPWVLALRDPAGLEGA